MDQGGIVESIGSVPQGDTDQARDGDQYTIRSIEFNFQFSCSPFPSGTDLVNICRMIVFQWFPDSIPNLSQILISAGTGNYTALSPWNHDRRFLYKILLDKTFVVSKATVAQPTDMSTQVSMNKITSGMKRKVQFQAASATDATNLIYMAAFSNSSATAGNIPQCTYFAKINFTDA